MEMQPTELFTDSTSLIAASAALSPEPSTTRQENKSGEIRLHRLKEVRREQGVSTRRVALHLGVDTDQVRHQESETTDLTLSQLYAWQQVLEVPVADLLVDSNSPLSPPVLQRARMVKLMKTATALVERSASGSLRKLAESLVDQLKEIMPELAGVNPWPAESQRRGARANNRVVHSTFQFSPLSD
jgi:transcriptional regulator with XRE-family HTH domain